MNRPRICLVASIVVLAIAVLNLPSALSQPTKPGQPDPDAAAAQKAVWQRLQRMAGHWKGTGRPGASKVEQRYRLILQDQFLQARTRSVTDNETHEDWEIYSFDKSRQRVVLRQFVSEGFVNRFVLDDISDGSTKLVFVTEACESAPSGFRARQTMTFESNDRISQQLELAPPGKAFSRCVATTLTRQR